MTTNSMENKMHDKRGGPKLNRYYEKLKPYYRIDSHHEGAGHHPPVIDKTLIFESRFESGNLKRAVKV